MKLWFDASVARKPAAFDELTQKARQRGVDAVIHAHVHLELCRHFRCVHRARFSQSYVDSYLQQRRVTILPMQLDRGAAERWAQRLYERFETTETWERAKLSTLGGSLLDGFKHLPAQMPMTTDWWVALQFEDSEEDVIAVDDKGGEWDSLRQQRRAFDVPGTRNWLDGLPLRPG